MAHEAKEWTWRAATTHRPGGARRLSWRAHVLACTAPAAPFPSPFSLFPTCWTHTPKLIIPTIFSFQQQLNFLCILISTWKLAETGKASPAVSELLRSLLNISLSCNWEGPHYSWLSEHLSKCLVPKTVWCCCFCDFCGEGWGVLFYLVTYSVLHELHKRQNKILV